MATAHQLLCSAHPYHTMAKNRVDKFPEDKNCSRLSRKVRKLLGRFRCCECADPTTTDVRKFARLLNRVARRFKKAADAEDKRVLTTAFYGQPPQYWEGRGEKKRKWNVKKTCNEDFDKLPEDKNCLQLLRKVRKLLGRFRCCECEDLTTDVRRFARLLKSVARRLKKAADAEDKRVLTTAFYGEPPQYWEGIGRGKK
ncbi:hypothetical protein M433DRAFT_428755 [Acidomyces richmondensis BFW]|nr:hypothetical protein M433DRAFT_428755 [Acidomyces richmondensis BFW]